MDNGRRVKMPMYDGKIEWKPYHLQFQHIANRYRWNDEQKLDKFIECLQDKALKVFSFQGLFQYRLISKPCAKR